MNQQELEDLFIRSMDAPMTPGEKEKFLRELQRYPELTRVLAQHKRVRELLANKVPASFGHYFASKLMYKIENTGVVIDRQIFSFFKKFQLAALGVIVGLLILNVMLSDQVSLTTIFGLDAAVTPAAEDADVPFDFFKTLNEDL